MRDEDEDERMRDDGIKLDEQRQKDERLLVQMEQILNAITQ